MAKNDLTPAQDVKTREFLLEVALAENTFSNNPASKKRLIGACYELLNYQRLTDGRFISKDRKISMSFGLQPSLEEYPDEWDTDYKRALDALNKVGDTVDESYQFTDNITNQDEADSSESSPDTEVRETIFSQDV